MDQGTYICITPRKGNVHTAEGGIMHADCHSLVIFDIDYPACLGHRPPRLPRGPSIAACGFTAKVTLGRARGTFRKLSVSLE